MSRTPLVVHVKRGSHEDGPGIRSVVFFKGCPLRCDFCQNPEAQAPGAEVAFYSDACIGCGRCAGACPNRAIDLESPVRVRRDRCQGCGACADACTAGGLRLMGTYYSVDRLVEVLSRDMPFYRHSGGGVTLSGGECTLYPDFVGALLGALKARGVHTAIQTSGHFAYETFKASVLPHLDLVFYDLKFADPGAHERHTGRSNRRIIKNLCRLLGEEGVEVHPRVPMVPGITTSEENLRGLVKILREAGAPRASLLPYNPLGLQMLESLGRSRPTLPRGFMKPDQEQRVLDLFGSLVEETSNNAGSP